MGEFSSAENDASTTLRAADLVRFVRSLGYDPIIVRLPEAESGQLIGRRRGGGIGVIAGPGEGQLVLVVEQVHQPRARDGGERLGGVMVGLRPGT